MSAACACGRVDLVVGLVADPAAGRAGHGLSSCAGAYRMPPATVAELVDVEQELAR